MKIKTEESRRFPRIKLLGPLRYQVRGTSDFNNTLSGNISLQGIGFTHNEFIAPSTLVMLEIPIVSRVLRPIGKIIWSSPFSHSNRYRFGVEFQELNSNEKKFLSDFITMRLNQATGA
jgi:hypothetical protein